MFNLKKEALRSLKLIGGTCPPLTPQSDGPDDGIFSNKARENIFLKVRVQL